MKIKCTVCNKEFYYGDHNSPMFIDEVWNKIINYFKLTNFEKEAAKKFSSYYKGGGKDYYPDHHVFICSECAEMALFYTIIVKLQNQLDWDILVLRCKKKQGAVKTLFTKF